MRNDPRAALNYAIERSEHRVIACVRKRSLNLQTTGARHRSHASILIQNGLRGRSLVNTRQDSHNELAFGRLNRSVFVTKYSIL
jgi:hypothetical protein